MVVRGTLWESIAMIFLFEAGSVKVASIRNLPGKLTVHTDETDSTGSNAAPVQCSTDSTALLIQTGHDSNASV